MKVIEIFRNPEALVGHDVEVEGLWLISNTDYFMWLVVDQIPFDVESSVLIERIPTSMKWVNSVCDDLAHALAMSGAVPRKMNEKQRVDSNGEFSLVSSIKVTGKLETSESTPSPYILTDIQRVYVETQGSILLFNDKYDRQIFIWHGVTLEDTRPKIEQYTTVPDILDNPQNFIGDTIRIRGYIQGCTDPQDQAYIVNEFSAPEGLEAIVINRRGILGDGFLIERAIPSWLVPQEGAEVTGQLVKVDHPKFSLALNNVSRIAVKKNPCTIRVWNFKDS